MLYNNEKLYLLLICDSVPILSVFTIASNSFVNYQFDSSKVVRTIILNPVTGALVMTGSTTDTSTKMYYISVFDKSLSSHPDISASSISTSTTSHYSSFAGSYTITDIGNIALTSVALADSDIQITEDTSLSYSSDVVYYYDTVVTITVNTLTSFESTVNTL